MNKRKRLPMSRKKKVKSLWGIAFGAAVLLFIYVGSTYPITMPLWLAIMYVCYKAGELKEVGEI